MDLLLKTACSFEKNSGDRAEIVHVRDGEEDFVQRIERRFSQPLSHWY